MSNSMIFQWRPFLNKCHHVYSAIPGTCTLCVKKQNVSVLFICKRISGVQTNPWKSIITKYNDK